MPPRYDRAPLPIDRNPLRQIGTAPGRLPQLELVDWAERIINIVIDHVEEIPVLGTLVKVLRTILDADQDGDIGFDDLKKLLGGLGAIFDPIGWLSNISVAQLSGGPSVNLITNGSFDGDVSMLAEAGWVYDAEVGRTKPGSARTTADGNRKVLTNKLIRGATGQQMPIAGSVKWSGLTVAAGSGPVFSIEVVALNDAGNTVATTTVATHTATSASGGWQQLSGTYTIPEGATGIKVRIAVEARATAGTVWWDDLEARKTGTMPLDLVTGLKDKLSELVQGILGVGNSIAGFLTGAGTAISETVIPTLLDLVSNALELFAGNTNQTATTADKAQGVGGNALTNTVAIQTQVTGMQEVQDAAYTARPLWASMDYTADSTFPLYLMQRATSHSHTWSGTISGSTGSGGGSVSVSISGTTSTESAGGSSHSHSFSDTDSVNISHTHPTGGSVSGTVAAAAAEYGAYTFTNAQAYIGFMRCGSVQEKRVFTFRGYSAATVTDLRLDIYLLSKATGTLTKLHTSSDLAGALTTSPQWIQYVIPAATAGIKVQPGDILGVQISIGGGTLALQGIDSLLTDNPPGFLPRRVGMLRSGVASNRNPATMNESIWSAGAGFIPYIEAGIDTGQASAPLSITDNFDGILSQQWLMEGPNHLNIRDNNFGIEDGGSNGTSWGKFNLQLRTDQSRAGFVTTSPNSQEQIVWFKGNSPRHHVGLAITNNYATLYTMLNGTRTNRASIAIGTVGATYEVRYTTADKTFTVWRNGTQIGSWTDSGNVAPSGLGNRFGGIGLGATRSGFMGISYAEANPIDNWLLADA